MVPNKTLKTKGMIQNDEFYTKREIVIKQCEMFKKYLTNKKIICPCDTKESEYYKVLKNEWNLNIKLSNDMFNVDYSKYDVVITNPPFSKINDFFKMLLKYKIKYLLICPWLFIGNKFFLTNMLNKNHYWSASFATNWKNSNKKVCCRFHTNISDKFECTKNNGKLTGKISDFNDIKMKGNIVRTCFHFQDFQCTKKEWNYLKKYAKKGVKSVSCYYLYIPTNNFIKQRIWQLRELPSFIKYLKKNASYISDVIERASKIWSGGKISQV